MLHINLLPLIAMTLGLIAAATSVKECVNRDFSSMCPTNLDKVRCNPSKNDFKECSLNLGELLYVERYSLAPIPILIFSLGVRFYVRSIFSSLIWVSVLRLTILRIKIFINYLKSVSKTSSKKGTIC